MLELRKVTPHHIERLAATMRGADRAEAGAWGYESPHQAIALSVQHAEVARAVTFKGEDEPLAIFGVARGSWLEDTTTLWVISAEGAWHPGTALAGVRLMKAMFRMLVGRYDAITTSVKAPHASTLRLLAWAGFEAVGPDESGTGTVYRRKL